MPILKIIFSWANDLISRKNHLIPKSSANVGSNIVEKHSSKAFSVTPGRNDSFTCNCFCINFEMKLCVLRGIPRPSISIHSPFRVLKIAMIEFWKFQLNNDSKIGAIKMNFSKAFDSLSHNFPLTRPRSYMLVNNSVECFSTYISKRCKNLKITYSFNELKKDWAHVPEGSILEPLLYVLFLFCSFSLLNFSYSFLFSFL